MRGSTVRWSDSQYLSRLEFRAGRISNPVERLRYLQARLSRTPPPVGAPVRRSWAGWIGLALMLAAAAPTGSGTGSCPYVARSPAAETALPPVREVWLVERTADFELYSNGLRVERAWCVPGQPRSPKWLAREGSPAAEAPPDPAGIVFHASESDPAPFDPRWTPRLIQQGEWLLKWVQQHLLYHFVVDRFGRVHRILEDSDRAHHAGRSVWADARWIYLDLNESFLGVCFEAATEGGGEALTAAQIHAGKLLVEMLRSRHRLPAENCITHAQVSVNPANRRIGYHTDWADGFPFAALGLPDNYHRLLPALLLFGFTADDGFLRRAGPGLRAAVQATEEEVLRQARRRGLLPWQYRRELAAAYGPRGRTLTGM